MSIKNIHMPTKKASKNGRGKQIILQLSLEKDWSGRFPPPPIKKSRGWGRKKRQRYQRSNNKIKYFFPSPHRTFTKIEHVLGNKLVMIHPDTLTRKQINRTK